MPSANENLTTYTATQAAASARHVAPHEQAHSHRASDTARTDDGAAIRAKGSAVIG